MNALAIPDRIKTLGDLVGLSVRIPAGAYYRVGKVVGLVDYAYAADWIEDQPSIRVTDYKLLIQFGNGQQEKRRIYEVEVLSPP